MFLRLHRSYCTAAPEAVVEDNSTNDRSAPDAQIIYGKHCFFGNTCSCLLCVCVVGLYRTICESGESFTEPYIAGHNVLNAHAKAVSTYRTKYKAEQRGIIGMTLNSDWAMVRERQRDKRQQSGTLSHNMFLLFCCLLSSSFLFAENQEEGLWLSPATGQRREPSKRRCQQR